MYNSLRRDLGLSSPDFESLLDFTEDENFKNWRQKILESLGTYIETTKRFQ